MIGDPDFLTGAAFDRDSEFPELETPEGDLHLRFFVPSGEEFALPATAIKEVISSSPEQHPFPMFLPCFWEILTCAAESFGLLI